ncbi:MAG: four helix bundle protein [Bacteroidetes bacterium]|nr:four helix bundle protein [Bacteroidota bacterium]MBU1679722.1 four helix bundle protein [Bacteroidota bacterium]MBU2505431.1 four helix bundle protein [Bacteroidota bacterium]
MKENVVRNKSFEFAIRIVGLYKYLAEDKKEYVLSKQVLRAGTSVGALVRESEHAESTADFIHKLSIALKEANETDYSLQLLEKSEYINQNEYESLNSDLTELLKLLTSIIKTTKSKK